MDEPECAAHGAFGAVTEATVTVGLQDGELLFRAHPRGAEHADLGTGDAAAVPIDKPSRDLHRFPGLDAGRGLEHLRAAAYDVAPAVPADGPPYDPLALKACTQVRC